MRAAGAGHDWTHDSSPRRFRLRVCRVLDIEAAELAMTA
jgi:hypothetical protein